MLDVFEDERHIQQADLFADIGGAECASRHHIKSAGATIGQHGHLIAEFCVVMHRDAQDVREIGVVRDSVCESEATLPEL
jgi:glucuronate isomerase